MGREIKFRAWGINQKYMWGWHELTYCYLKFLNDKDSGERAIMQYTGIKLKGVELYEGDIVKFRGNYTEKKKCGWHHAAIKWAGYEYFLDGYRYDWEMGETDEFENKAEIIGNIYQNKDLLKKEHNDNKNNRPENKEI